MNDVTLFLNCVILSGSKETTFARYITVSNGVKMYKMNPTEAKEPWKRPTFAEVSHPDGYRNRVGI